MLHTAPSSCCIQLLTQDVANNSVLYTFPHLAQASQSKLSNSVHDSFTYSSLLPDLDEFIGISDEDLLKQVLMMKVADLNIIIFHE
jgi:hypothetical protein